MQKDGQSIPPDAAKKIEAQMSDVLNYHPKVGVLGKTGSGKSSLCNALFGSDTAKIDDVKGCTRTPQEILLHFGEGRSITLVDVPGVGENAERDVEYRELYKNLLPQLDLVVWVVKADDRALSVDELFVMEDLKPLLYGKPFVVAINQVDKLNPLREWDVATNQPGVRQQASITEKTQLVAKFFNLQLNRVVAVSAEEKYNLPALVEGMVFALPSSQKPALFREVKQQYRSEKAEAEAEKGFLDTLNEIVDKALALYKKIEPYIPVITAVATKIFRLFMKR
jgi:uncharacterized protein